MLWRSDDLISWNSQSDRWQSPASPVRRHPPPPSSVTVPLLHFNAYVRSISAMRPVFPSDLRNQLDLREPCSHWRVNPVDYCSLTELASLRSVAKLTVDWVSVLGGRTDRQTDGRQAGPSQGAKLSAVYMARGARTRRTGDGCVDWSQSTTSHAYHTTSSVSARPHYVYTLCRYFIRYRIWTRNLS